MTEVLTPSPVSGTDEPSEAETSELAASALSRQGQLRATLTWRTLRRFAPVLAVVAGLAALAGWVLALRSEKTHTATTVIELLDDNVGWSQHTVSPEELEAERQILESNQLRSDLESALDTDAAALRTISATTADDTTLITIAVSATSSTIALEAVDQLVATFRRQRVESQVTLFTAEAEEIGNRIAEQEELVSSLEAELDAVNDDNPTTEETVTASALHTRLVTSVQRSQELQQVLRELETETTLADGRISVIDRPIATAETSRSRPLTAAQAGLATAVVGGGLVVASSTRSRKYRLVDEIELDYPDLPVLAAVPRFRATFRERRNSVVVGRADAMREAEAFRFLRTAVQLAMPDDRPFAVAVTSSMPGEGKTVSAANLAVSFAGGGQATMLIDGDLLSPSIPELSARPDAVNSFPAFMDSGDLDGLVTSIGTAERRLDLLISEDPLAAARVDRRRELVVDVVRSRLRQLHSSHDAVVIDCPPAVLVADAVTMAAAADGVVVVVRLGEADKSGVARAVDGLEQGGARILGFVATHADDDGSGYGTYHYGADRRGDR